MRWDMNEVIVETGRSGMRERKGELRVIQNYARTEDYEGFPTHESMSRHRYSSWRSMGDKLNPLRRYLRANLGRKWDDVYSEIRAVNDKRSILGFHLLTHLAQYIDLGKPKYWRNRFFEDENGILREYPTKPWRTRNREELRLRPVEKVIINESRYYELLKGVWFRYDARIIRYMVPEFIFWNGRVKPAHEVIETVWDKKQANKKELRVVRDMAGKGINVVRAK